MRKLIVCLIVLVFAAVPASAMVLDGSFEGFAAVGSGWTAIAYDGDTFGAWTAHMPAGRNAWLYDDATITVPDGTTSLHLGDGYDIGAVSQLVSGFSIGATYEVSLAAIAYADGTSHPGGGLKVTDLGTGLDDLDVTFVVNPGTVYSGEPWIYSSFLFTASNTELELSISNPTNGYALHVDDVTIVPEPATICLLGLGGLLLRRRR